MSQTGVVSFSQTASINATADSAVNFAEGMAPSAVNDSARALMASIAKYRDDISGAIVTGGTNTAFTVTSYQSFSSLSVLANQVVAFTPHATCGATVTLNVDSLGAKPLRSSPGVELVSGHLVQGTPYTCVYNSSDGAFYLSNFYGNPYSIPIGGMIDFTGSTAPNSSFVLPFGQAISRSVYSAYFNMPGVGTTYGSGDGSTTFNVPDLRGRFTAGKDDMGGAAANRITNAVSGITGATLGSSGGSQSHTLTLAELPTGITSSASVTGTATSFQINGSTTNFTILNKGGAGGSLDFGTGAFGIATGSSMSASVSATGTATSNNTSGNAHAIIPPAMIVNKLLRII